MHVLSVRTKMLAAVVASVLALSAAIYLISTLVILPSYAAIEREGMMKDLQRGDDAIQEYIRQQGVKIEDWAQWDDAYEYALYRDQDYIDTNINASAVYNLDLHAMVYIDLEGKLINSLAVNRTTAEEAPSDEIVAGVLAEPTVALHESLESMTDGIIMLPSGPLIINSRPMRQSGGAGPAAGTLVYARYLDTEKVKDFADITHLTLFVYRYDQTRLPKDVQEAKAKLDAGVEHVITAVSAEKLTGYTLLHDIHNAPALILKVEQPRPIYEQGNATFSLYLIIGAVALLVFGGVVLFLLDRLVIDRFIRLTQDVEEINEIRDLSLSVGEGPKDEIGRLADKINQMLQWLNQAREGEAKARREMLNLVNDLKKDKEQTEEFKDLLGKKE